jgi:hypothetical protein
VEKGKGIFSSLRSRRNVRVALNMDDEHQLEDDLIYKEEALDVHATRWQDPRMLKEMHIEEDFSFFLEHTRLDGFASRPYKTYAEITREFLASFRFARTKERAGKRCKIIPVKFDVEFVMKQNRFFMSLDEFCKAFMSQILGVGKKSLVILMNNSGILEKH